MNTDLIDRWEEFQRMDDRVKFDMHMEGLLAQQKVEAALNMIATGTTTEEIAGALYQDDLNSHLLLEMGAPEL